jgi:hypothetical protein
MPHRYQNPYSARSVGKILPHGYLPEYAWTPRPKVFQMLDTKNIYPFSLFEIGNDKPFFENRKRISKNSKLVVSETARNAKLS